jgi:Phage terminase, small subunit
VNSYATNRPIRATKEKAISTSSAVVSAVERRIDSDSRHSWQVGEPEPPRRLDTPGRALWDSVQAEYRITDSAGVEMLAQACQALDRAEQLADAVAGDGVIVHTAMGVRTHPAVKEELACRAFVVRTLSRLGLDLEAAKPAGRPVIGGLGVKRA